SGSAVLEFALELQALNATEAWSYASEAGSGTLGEGGSDWHRPREDRKSTVAGHGPSCLARWLARAPWRIGLWRQPGHELFEAPSEQPRDPEIAPSRIGHQPANTFRYRLRHQPRGQCWAHRGRATQLALQPGLFVGPLSPVPCSLF